MLSKILSKIVGIATIAKAILLKKNVYAIRFVCEDDNKWYVDFPNWPFDHHNLMMVAGADKLCALLSNDGRHTEVSVYPAKQKKFCPSDMKYVELERIASRLFGGAFYEVHNIDFPKKTIWLCPVTLCVLGRYPKYIYLKKQ